MEKFERLKLHFTYCSFILVGLLILVATDRWSGQPKFTEFLSNAATMTSLFLGVVAIFYSIVSNGDLSKNLGSISKVSEDVSAARQAVANVVSRSEEMLKQSATYADELSQISSNVDLSVGALRQAMAQLEVHTSNIKASVDTLPTRLDSLEAKIIESATSNAKGTNISSSPQSDEIASRCLSQISLAGGFAIYGAVLAHRSQKQLDIDAYQAAMGASTGTYLHGVIVVLDAIDLIDVKHTPGKTRTISITAVAEAFAALDHNAMLAWVEAKAGKYKSTTIDVPLWHQKVAAVEAFMEAQ